MSRFTKLSQDDDGEGKGKGKAIGGKFLQFLKEVGGTKTKSPWTGKEVTLKTLSSQTSQRKDGYKGSQIVQRYYKRWEAAQKKKEKEKPEVKTNEPSTIDRAMKRIHRKGGLLGEVTKLAHQESFLRVHLVPLVRKYAGENEIL